jgi:hypothetical protein
MRNELHPHSGMNWVVIVLLFGGFIPLMACQLCPDAEWPTTLLALYLGYLIGCIAMALAIGNNA